MCFCAHVSCDLFAQVMPASAVDICHPEMLPAFATLKEHVTPSMPVGNLTGSKFSSCSTVGATTATPLHLSLSSADAALSSHSAAMGNLSMSSPVMSGKGSSQRRRSTAQLRRRLQTPLTSAVPCNTSTSIRSRDLGDAASPLPLLKGPARTLGLRRNTRSTAAGISRTFSLAGASVNSSPATRTSRGAWTLNSSFPSTSRNPLSAGGSTVTPTKSPAHGLSTPSAYSYSIGLNLPFTPTASATLKSSGTEDRLQMDACVSLAWMDVRHAVEDSAVSASFIHRDFSGQLFACFMQRAVKKLTFIPIMSDGHVMGVPQVVTSVYDVLPLNDIGLLAVADERGLHFQASNSQVTVWRQPLPASVQLHDVVSSCLSVIPSDNGPHTRVSFSCQVNNPVLDMCISTLGQSLPSERFGSFCLHFYSALSHRASTTVSAKWSCFKTALCHSVGLQCLSLDCDMDVSSGSQGNAELDEASLIDAACSPSHSHVPPATLFKAVVPEQSLYSLSSIFHRLHLVYEESKLDIAWSNTAHHLACLLTSLAYSLQLPGYVQYYMADHPTFAPVLVPFVHPNPVSYKLVPQLPVSITQQLSLLLNGSPAVPEWPLNSVCKRSRMLCHLYRARRRLLQDSSKSVEDSCSMHDESEQEDAQQKMRLYNQLATDIASSDLNGSILESLPIGFRVPLEQMLEWCRAAKLASLPLSVCHLLGRSDLLRQSQLTRELEIVQPPLAVGHWSSSSDDVHDGLQFNDPQLSLRYPKDRRMDEVAALLESVKPVQVVVEQKQGVTDHDHQQDLVHQLMMTCQRTFSLPIGRGAATLRSRRALLTEPFRVPELCNSGRTPLPRSIEVKMREEDKAEMKWPLFHNGVASGLALSGDKVDAKWILHNRPGEDEKQQEHGGFLFALGLNNHLRALQKNQMYEYLTQLNASTTIGLLLGISAMHCASRHQLTLRLLSLHIAPLRPPNSQVVKVEPLVQVAAVHGLGLLFMGSSNQHLSSILVQQIGSLPEHNDLKELKKFERHAYSLACGASLGMIMLGLGQGQTAKDLQLTSHLLSYLDGTEINQSEQTSSVKETVQKESKTIDDPEASSARTTADSLLLNGSGSFDVHCTAPAAVLALSLMYLKTNCREAAGWLQVQFSAKEICSTRPDVLLMRTAGSHLIMWDSMEASAKWFDAEYSAFKNFCSERPSPRGDFEEGHALIQAGFAYEAGLCLALGIRYAGSLSEKAFLIIMDSFVKLSPFLDPDKGPEVSDLEKYKKRHRAGKYYFKVILLSIFLSGWPIATQPHLLDFFIVTMVLAPIRHVSNKPYSHDMGSFSQTENTEFLIAAAGGGGILHCHDGQR